MVKKFHLILESVIIEGEKNKPPKKQNNMEHNIVYERPVSPVYTLWGKHHQLSSFCNVLAVCELAVQGHLHALEEVHEALCAAVHDAAGERS